MESIQISEQTSVQTSVETFEPNAFERFYIYQRERFPLKKYAPLVAAFSYSGLALSYLVTGSTHAITFHMFAVAFIVILALFAQLRICDEFKDKDIDARYHPERPVPSGLISLESLKNAGLLLGAVQILLVLSLDAVLLGPLLLAYAYLYLMTREFFVGAWLRDHAAIYMISHMFILFFTDLFITSCHWMVSGLTPPPALLYFFGMSFMLGMIIEIGRKMRASQDEKPGVETYSQIWGAKQAVAVWLMSAAIAAGFLLKTATYTYSVPAASLIMLLLVSHCLYCACRYLFSDSRQAANDIESASGTFTLIAYLTVGLIPYLQGAL